MIFDRKIMDTSIGEVEFLTLRSETMQVVLCSYGASIYEIEVLGQKVTVAPMDIDQFLHSPFYYGKTIGRTSGRLFLPSFTINHEIYPIKPFPMDHIYKHHGGYKGFSFKHFQLLSHTIKDDYVSVSFLAIGKHMEEDFPGELRLVVTYRLDQDMGLRVTYEAKSDHDTLCNITNHTYFNLSLLRHDIKDHELTVYANHYIDLDKDYRMKGVKPVKNTVFDFTEPKLIGEGLDMLSHTPFQGYDHPYILEDRLTNIILDDDSSMVRLKIKTSYPSAVIYTHNHQTTTHSDLYKPLGMYYGIAIEPQFEPDGIHHQELHQAILRKNELYKHTIVYQFERK